MARIIDNNKKINTEAKLMQDIVEIQQDNNFTEYSKHLDSKPVFVHYYSQDSILSTADSGLQAPENLMGDDCSIKYNRVKYLPLYAVPSTGVDLDLTEYGINPSAKGDAVIVPGTINPKPNDYFKFVYFNRPYIFKVTEVDADTIRSNHYFKISFSFDKISEEIDKNVAEDYTVIYDNIGNNETRALLKDDEIELYEKLEMVYSSLLEGFMDWHLNYDANIYTLSDESEDQISTVDPYVNYFINKFDKSTNKLDSTVDSHFAINYKNSIYGLIENPDVNRMKNRFINTFVIREPRLIHGSIQYIHDITQEIVLSNVLPVKEDSKFEYNELYSMYYIDDKLIKYIFDNVEFELIDDKDRVMKIIGDFIKSSGKLTQENLDFICSQYWLQDYSRKSYILVPLLLYIIDYKCKSIMKNKK